MGGKSSRNKHRYDDEFGVQADTGSPSATYGDASYKSATYGKDVKHVDYDVSQKRGPPGGGGGGGGGGRAH